MDLPRPLRTARTDQDIDGVRLDLSSVFTPFSPLVASLFVVPGVWAALTTGLMTGAVAWVEGVGPMSDPAATVTTAVVLGVPILAAALSVLPLFYWAATQRVGLVVELTAHQLVIRHRLRVGEEVIRVALADIEDAAWVGDTVVIRTTTGRHQLRVPGRSHATREAFADLLARHARWAGTRDGERSEVPAALLRLEASLRRTAARAS